MSLKKTFLVLSSASTIVVFAYGCGSGDAGAYAAGDGGPIPDAAIDKKGLPDAPSDGLMGCMPADEAAFTPPTFVPPSPAQNACSGTQINDYYSKCLDATTKDKAACDAWQLANTSCIGCLVTPATSKSWGALVSDQGVAVLNIAGCVALVAGNTDCATKFQAAEACDATACKVNCPITTTDTGSFAAYVACLDVAANNTCKPWQQKQKMACTNNDASVASVCTDHGSFAEFFKAIAPIFCSSGG